MLFRSLIQVSHFQGHGIEAVDIIPEELILPLFNADKEIRVSMLSVVTDEACDKHPTELIERAYCVRLKA